MAKKDIFISYSSKDKDKATDLVSALEQFRDGIWIDRFEIDPGESWEEKITEGVENSKCLIILCSENSLNSEWVKNEVTLAQKAESNKFLIPVLIDNSQLPSYLKDKQYIEMKTWEINQRLPDKLITTLRKRRLIPDWYSDYKTNLAGYGLAEIIEKFELASLIERAKANQTILLLNTWHPLLDQTDCKIKEALKQGVKFKILAIDNQSNSFKYRSDELEVARARTDKLNRYISDLYYEQLLSIKENNEKFLIKLYKNLPCIPMYILVDEDDNPIEAYTGFYLSKCSTQFIHIHWKPSKNGAIREFYNYFNMKWNNTSDTKLINSADYGSSD